MLFQTLVQLNILILATPALAGWGLLPLAQPGVVRAACVGFPGRTAEAVAPKITQAGAVHALVAVRPQPAVLPRVIGALIAQSADSQPAFSAAAPAALLACDPFPHATRAP